MSKSGPSPRELGIPLYVQVRERLRSDLAQLEPGTMISPEIELERRFGVSRITIRKAIHELVSEGLLIRRQGRGTFVEQPKLTHELDTITSWTEQLKSLGYAPRTTNLEIERIPAPRRILQSLALAEGGEVLVIRRVRAAGEEPISLMTNYIPAKLVPEFESRVSGYESLYDALEREYGLIPMVALDYVETRAATDAESSALKIEPWAPVLTVTRISHLESGAPLEMTVAVSRGDRYKYVVKLRGRVRGR
jgi:GntR family transcriptional regulator